MGMTNRAAYAMREQSKIPHPTRYGAKPV